MFVPFYGSGGGWNQVIFEVSSNLSRSMILQAELLQERSCHVNPTSQSRHHLVITIIFSSCYERQMPQRGIYKPPEESCLKLK